MPLPSPNSGEGHDDWMKRCMANSTMNDEHPDNDQRLAICEGIWDDKDSKSANPKVERRILGASDAELRVNDDGKPPHIIGYGARFNRDSEDMGFVERIKPGAFAEALKKSDIRGLFNHDPNFVLGRVSAKTMGLAENSRGLKYDILAPNTAQARGVLEAVRRGDVTGSSFSFIVAEGGDEWTEKDGDYIRTITKFDELFDVGPVTFPAYGDTSVAVRSLVTFKEGRKAEVTSSGIQAAGSWTVGNQPANADQVTVTVDAQQSAEDKVDDDHYKEVVQVRQEEPTVSAAEVEAELESREENEPTQMDKNKQLLDEADARRCEAARKRVDDAIAS